MKKSFWSILLLSALFAPAVALAEDAKSVMQCVQDKQLARWKGVDSYAVVQNIAGQRSTEYFQRVEVKADDGKVHTVFRRVSMSEYQAIAGRGTGAAQMDSTEFMEAYSKALDSTGSALGSQIENGMQQAGLPKGMLAATGSDPWATFDPRVMLGGGSKMLKETAAHQRKQQKNPKNPAADINDMAQFVDSAELVGHEKVDGRDAYRLRAENIDKKQEADGQTFEMQTVNMWIDKKHCVPLKMRIDGLATSGGETRPIFMEKSELDYRPVADSKMYESYRKVMRMGGVMDAAQQKEIQRAQKELAKFEQQMASMPESQRTMMENMIGPQMKTMRTMASGGAFESEIVIDEIKVNTF